MSEKPRTDRVTSRPIAQMRLFMAVKKRIGTT
jgi:hypothetical protein